VTTTGRSGTGERHAQRFNGAPIRFGCGRVEGEEVVDECRVDHAVGCLCSTLQAIKIIESTTMHIGPDGLERCSGRIRAGKAENLVPRTNQFARWQSR
jgi:hypothetical protein